MKGISDVRQILDMIGKQSPESFNVSLEYLIEPEILKGALVLLTGAPASGKSTLVLHWCVELAKAGNEVLYLDRDNPLVVVKERIERFGGVPTNFLYWGLWTTDENGDPLEPPDLDSPFLLDAVGAMNNPVIVVDTLATFHNGDENDSNIVGTTFKALRKLTSRGATVIVIHHTGKNKSSDYRGSSTMPGAVDLAWKVIGTTDYEGLLTRIDVISFKTRIANAKPIQYKVEDGIPRRVTVTATDRLFDFLAQHQGLSKEDFETTAMKSGFKRSFVRSTIDKGIAAGRIIYEKRKLSIRPEHERRLPFDATAEHCGELRDVA